MSFSKRKKTIALSWLITLMVIGIVVMVGYISTEHFVRLDLTENQVYAISPASKQVLNELDDIVTVKVFFSKELPPNLVAVRQYTEDLLGEFESFAHGRLKVRLLDPAEEDMSREARTLGIPPIRMNILSRDKFEVKSGFLGIAIMYGDRHEILPVVQEVTNLEYDLISAIRKLNRAELRHIGFSEGHNEYPIVAKRAVNGGEGHVLARAALEKDYKVSSITLSESGALKDINTLVIGGAETFFDLREKYALDQFLMRGGNLIFLIDGVKVEGFQEATLLDIGLSEMLVRYGASVEAHLALDQLNEAISFGQELLQFTTPYPFWIKAVKDYFNQKNPITSRLDTIVFPWSSPVKLSLQEGIVGTLLVQTSRGAWIQYEPFDLSPDVKPPQNTNQYSLAVLLEGRFKSFFAGGWNPDGFMPESNGKGRIIVVGNSRFLTDYIVRQYKGNLTFFLNMVDFLTLDENLIGIRSKVIVDRPLIKLSDMERQVIKLGGIFLVPILIIMYGVLRSFERKKKKIKL